MLQRVSNLTCGDILVSPHQEIKKETDNKSIQMLPDYTPMALLLHILECSINPYHTRVMRVLLY